MVRLFVWALLLFLVAGSQLQAYEETKLRHPSGKYAIIKCPSGKYGYAYLYSKAGKFQGKLRYQSPSHNWLVSKYRRKGYR